MAELARRPKAGRNWRNVYSAPSAVVRRDRPYVGFLCLVDVQGAARPDMEVGIMRDLERKILAVALTNLPA